MGWHPMVCTVFHVHTIWGTTPKSNRLRFLGEKAWGGGSRPAHFFSNARDAELMQKRWPPCSLGPSGKTWPRWPPQVAQVTSTRFMPKVRSSCSSTASLLMGSKKLGQPEPDSNFVPAGNSAALQPAQW